jgi:sulfur carrier protein ThiS
VEVTVNLYGELRKYVGSGKKLPLALRVPAGLAVRDVLDYLKIPAGAPLAVVVNGEHHDRTRTLSEGDVVSVFSMAGLEPASEPPPAE